MNIGKAAKDFARASRACEKSGIGTTITWIVLCNGKLVWGGYPSRAAAEREATYQNRAARAARRRERWTVTQGSASHA